MDTGSVFNSPEHSPTREALYKNKRESPSYSPCKTALVALGIIFIIGGAVAAGLLYSQLGYVALSCLSAVPVGIALIVVGLRKQDSKGTARTSSSTSESQEVVDSRIAVQDSVMTIGSEVDRLTEQEIVNLCARLGSLIQNDLRRGVRHLVIYGTADLKLEKSLVLNAVPHLERLIIVGGGRIIHMEPAPGIDTALYALGWASNGRRGMDKTSTWLVQREVEYLEHALQLEQDQPTVYRVLPYESKLDRIKREAEQFDRAGK